MTIEIKIPQDIINKCTECGWGEQEIKVHFASYLSEVMNHPYNHFQQDFQTWLQDLDEEEVNKQAEQVAQGLTIEDLRGVGFTHKDYKGLVYVVGTSVDGVCKIHWGVNDVVEYKDEEVVQYIKDGTWIL